ncbi:RNA polymerase sigma factor [Leptolyngbya sp. AN03gr2]|uniref:RNA polymerase sigma factor n=1 Tax=unclassified Leptolyngbya TaxID=2650499 RepID=UPI003D31817E
MSVSDLEQYLLRDNIEAGQRLLTQREYREKIHQVARGLFNSSFPQYLEDAVQEAEVHTLGKARQHEFLAALFCKVLRKQGGKVNRKPNSPHRINKIPPAILERASQLGSEQGIEIACGAFCFCQEFNDAGQSVTLLTSDHPLRKAVIELALGEDGVCPTTLDEFYAWHYSVARNKIRDCFRRYQGQALLSLDRLDRMKNPLIDSIPAEDTNRDLEEEIDREQLRQQAIRCLQQINLLSPDQRYSDLYEELYVQGKTKKQVADEWNLAESTISRRNTKLKQKILQCLGKLGVQIPEDNSAQQRRRRSQTDYDS